jgi:lipoate-protein ligase A
MPRSWRLVDSGLVSPPVSAALDEAILETHVAGAVPNTLHFYIRSAPTISIGHFQRVSESVDVSECESRGVALIRRMSGGSSIYTDSGQLIYGLVVGESDLPSDRMKSFTPVCEAIAKAIASFGIEARYRPVNDVEVGGRKVSGSAQLRRKSSVLQHGTILVDTDLGQMDAVLKVGGGSRGAISRPSERVTTLRALLGVAPDMTQVKSALVRALREILDADFSPSSLSSREEALVSKLVGERYSRKEWNFRL